MSNRGARTILEEIHRVHDLIERCLLREMTPSEVVDTLYNQAKIEPVFTEVVLKQLIAQNQEFFREYRLKLMAKDLKKGHQVLRSRL